jgi:hypothetical protein
MPSRWGRPTASARPVVGDFGANATQRTARGGVYISASDFNPERIFFARNHRDGSPPQRRRCIPTAVGVLDYSFGNFKLEVTQAYFSSSGNLPRELTRAQDANQLAIASFNVENLDIGDGQAKFETLAAQIVTNLASPDIIGLMEVQDSNGATDNGVVDASVTLNTLISAITTAGGPGYSYRQINPVNDQDGGEPGGNIRVPPGSTRASPRRPRGGTSTAATTRPSTAGSPSSASALGVSIRPIPRSPTAASAGGEFLFNGRSSLPTTSTRKEGTSRVRQFQPPALASETQRRSRRTWCTTPQQSILAVNPILTSSCSGI